jgi:hypothetical protein
MRLRAFAAGFARSTAARVGVLERAVDAALRASGEPRGGGGGWDSDAAGGDEMSAEALELRVRLLQSKVGIRVRDRLIRRLDAAARLHRRRYIEAADGQARLHGALSAARAAATTLVYELQRLAAELPRCAPPHRFAPPPPAYAGPERARLSPRPPRSSRAPVSHRGPRTPCPTLRRRPRPRVPRGCDGRAAVPGGERIQAEAARGGASGHARQLAGLDPGSARPTLAGPLSPWWGVRWRGRERRRRGGTAALPPLCATVPASFSPVTVVIKNSCSQCAVGRRQTPARPGSTACPR